MRLKYYYHKKKSKSKPVFMSREIIRFRARINENLRYHKSRIFRKYKRFSFLKKIFFKRFSSKTSRRTDLLYLYRRSHLNSSWISKRYFSRSKKPKKVNFFIKRMKQRYFKFTNWSNRIKARYYRRTPKLFATSPFRYQLIDDKNNRKKFRIWITTKFFGKRQRFVFRIFYFFRKLEKAKFNFRKKRFPKTNQYNVDPVVFFEKYRKFSLWAISYAWHKFQPRKARIVRRRLAKIRRRNYLIIKRKRKKIFTKKGIKRFFSKNNKKLVKNSKLVAKKKLKLKLKKNAPRFLKKKFAKKKRQRNIFKRKRSLLRFFFNRRRFTRRRTYRIRLQRSRFIKTVQLSYKFPHNRILFKFKFLKKFNFKKRLGNRQIYKVFSGIKSPFYKDSFYSLYRLKSPKLLRPNRINSNQLFFTKQRIPKIFIKNFFYKKLLPLSYYFTRSQKKFKVIFKTFKKKRKLSRFLKYKHKYRVPFRVKRLLRKLRFYILKTKKLSKFSKNLNKKIFFVRRKYSKFLPYLGYFRKFGKKKFIYKKKRKKFFRYFKKFFSKFHSVTAIPTLRHKHYITQSRSVRLFIHIFKSVNNMFINVSAPRGRTIYSYSAGRTHFRGSKRLSPVAIETIGKNVSLLLKNSKILQVGVVFHTPIDYLVRALMRGFRTNIKFTYFKYYITKPHNGLRLRSSRRI
jgi:ribosomal protein S11